MNCPKCGSKMVFDETERRWECIQYKCGYYIYKKTTIHKWQREDLLSMLENKELLDGHQKHGKEGRA